MLVRVRGPANAFDAVALVDTGADHCCFPANVAPHLGIDLRPDSMVSVGTVGQPVKAWEHEVLLEFPQLGNYRIDARILFVDNPDLSPLIGREPLLSRIQLGFRQSRNTFYVLTVP
ncbi:MAG: retroviral-like aspartic protease [Chloroflexi bacterium]|nr:retroviral-like aspartic protease [Chloroflexota bacterium]